LWSGTLTSKVDSSGYVPPIESRRPDSRRAILVVDDSRVQRRILTASLRRWGYDVIEADSGGEALAVLKERQIDIVLSDWMMPGMDGPDLCRAFRNLQRDHYGYFILLTSKSGKEDVARGLDVGADDFLSKPVSPSELRARLAAGERILTMAQELVEKNAKLQAAHDRLNRDLLEARRLQMSLIPERYRDLGSAQLALLMRPAGHVGGDLVGHFRINEQKLAVYSIDVSGHGVASALMTAQLASYLSGSSPHQNVALEADEFGLFSMKPPHEVADGLNQLLLREMQTDLYFTMCLAEIDLPAGRVRLVQAGHPNPIIQRASGKIEFVSGGGLPIGLIKDAKYEEQEIELNAGDRFLIYSDGFTECAGSEGELLDESGLVSLMQKASDIKGYDFFEALVWNLESFAGTSEFGDDLSGVFLEFDGLA
jgi:sigma-B regulation protein RsbU (phosphoserine phosphatase)